MVSKRTLDIKIVPMLVGVGRSENSGRASINEVGTIFSLVGIGCNDLPIHPPTPGSYGPAMLVGVPHSSPPS